MLIKHLQKICLQHGLKLEIKGSRLLEFKISKTFKSGHKTYLKNPEGSKIKNCEKNIKIVTKALKDTLNI